MHGLNHCPLTSSVSFHTKKSKKANFLGYPCYDKQNLPSSLSGLKLVFQIVAVYAFDNVFNRPIYSTLQKQWNLSFLN